MAEKPILWTGIIDLHQGDRGKIFFKRKGLFICGKMQVRRGDQLFEPNRIEGTWQNNKIQFTRYLNETTIQPFEGHTITEPNFSILINGRFANKLQGCWNAFIHQASSSPNLGKVPSVELTVNKLNVFTLGDRLKVRVSAEDNQTDIRQINIFLDGIKVASHEGRHCEYDRELGEPGCHCIQAEAVGMDGRRGRSEVVSIMVHPTSKTGPSLEMRITPKEPTEQDRIEFDTQSAHPTGVSEIRHYINGRLVRTCNSSLCIVKKGPFPAGTITWRVFARSNDGGETFGHERTIIITRRKSGSCRISGKAVGPNRQSAQEFTVSLFGPDNLDKYRDSMFFDSKGRFHFPNLPEGQYRLAIHSGANTPVNASPSHIEINCAGAGLNNLQITFLPSLKPQRNHY